MYPFKQGQLKGLIEEAGFVRVQVYSDFCLGIRENCDFFTYVASKES